MNGWPRCCRSDTLEQVCRVFWRMLRGEGLSIVGRMSFQNSVEVCFHPRGETVSYEDVFLIT